MSAVQQMTLDKLELYSGRKIDDKIKKKWLLLHNNRQQQTTPSEDKAELCIG